MPVPVVYQYSNSEEVGHGAAAGIPDDVAELIAVDMGALGESLQGNEHAVSICAKDSGGPYDLGIRRRLVALAQAQAAVRWVSNALSTNEKARHVDAAAQGSRNA